MLISCFKMGRVRTGNAHLFILHLVVWLISLSSNWSWAGEIDATNIISDNYRITKVVANEDTYSATDPSLNDHGHIAFLGRSPGGPYNDVYLYDGDKITNITSGLKVYAEAPIINNAGQIAFWDSDYWAQPQRSDIYLYEGKALKNITADLDVIVGPFSINDLGQVAFVGHSPSDLFTYYIYFYDGTNIKTNFHISAVFSNISLNNKGQIAFSGGYYTSPGILSDDIYILEGTRVTNITSSREDLGFTYNVDLNDYGQLTFTHGNDIYLYDGATFKNITADLKLPTGDVSMNYQAPQINNQGQVAFIRSDDQYNHIYLYNYNRDMLSEIGVFGKDDMLSRLSLNNKGQIALGHSPYGYDQSQDDIYFYDGQKFINITYNKTNYCPCPSLDINEEGQIAFSGVNDSANSLALYLYDGKDFNNITTNITFGYRGYGGIGFYPSLNNKGQVAFSTPSVPITTRSYSFNDVYFYDGESLRHITANMELRASFPSLNNNGWVAFSGSPGNVFAPQPNNIYLYDGNILKNLTENLGISGITGELPSLNDRGQVAFTVSTFTNSQYRSDISFYDGSSSTNITGHLPVSSSRPRLNNNGQMAFEGYDQVTGRSDIYFYDGKEITNITAGLDFYPYPFSLQLNDYGQIAFINSIRKPGIPLTEPEGIYFFDGAKIIRVVHLDKAGYTPAISLNNQGQIIYSDYYSIYLAQPINPNKPPTAEVGPNQIVIPGSTVKLDGSGSSDPEGESLSYRWLLVAKPIGSKAYLSDHNQANPTLVTDLAGVYDIQLVVNDGIDESAPDKVIITAVASNQGPIAYAGPDQFVSTSSIVTLDGTNSYSSDKKDLAYSWSLISKPGDSKVSLANTGGKIITFTADAVGTYKVQLMVNNSQSVSEPDTLTIIALGQESKIRVATNKSGYAPGDTLELYLWVGHSFSATDSKADAFIGFGLPDDSLYFFDPALNLNPADSADPRSFIPLAQGVTLFPGFVFPGPGEMNADSDGNGKLDSYRLFSVTLPPNLPAGVYYAFAALAEPGTVRSGNAKLIGQVSIAPFTINR